MRKQLSKIIFILIISLFIHPLTSYSEAELELTEEHIRREPLKGIEGVYVLIESLFPVTKELGITEESLKTKVELKLRLAGIKISSREELVLNFYPVLYVDLSTVRWAVGDISLYAFNIDITLRETAYIKRNNKSILAATWKSGGIGIHGKQEILEQINNMLQVILNRFLNDYLAVNPKK